MKIRRNAYFAVALLVAVVVMVLLILPMLEYAGARKKFPLGMPLAQAQKVARKPFRLVSGEAGVVYGPPQAPCSGAPPAALKDTEVLAEMYCDGDGALLLFNADSKLIGIRPTRSLLDIFISRVTGELQDVLASVNGAVCELSSVAGARRQGVSRGCTRNIMTRDLS